MPSVKFAAPDEATLATPPITQVANEGTPLRQLKWDESSHFAVITQLHGSVIPQVIPYCIVNAIWAGVLYELKRRDVVDLTSNPSGHKYMAIIMSFLLVTRVKIIYDRYMVSATSLHACYMAARETVQWMVAMTRTDQVESAKQWRHDVAYAVIVLLRVTMAVLDFQSNPNQIPWALADVNDEHKADIQGNMFLSIFKLQPGAGQTDDEDDEDNEDDALRPPPPVKQQQQQQHSAQALLAHTSDDERVMLEEACRAPVVLAYNVRKEILKQRDGTWLTLTGPQKTWHHPCNEEMRLLDTVGDFLHNFHNIRKLILTPLPFPLVNMSKIFLFLWVFTVPFAICHFDFPNLGTVVPVLMVFLITFGFVGLEYVSIELSDPFGDDPSDFDDFGMAQICFEDIYLAIYKCDGAEWAKKLRDRTIPVLRDTALSDFRERYQENWKTYHPGDVRSSLGMQKMVKKVAVGTTRKASS